MDSTWNRQLLDIIEELTDFTFNNTALRFIGTNHPSDHPEDIIHLIDDYVADQQGNLTGISIDRLEDEVQLLDTLTRLESIILNTEQLDIYARILEKLPSLNTIIVNDDPSYDHAMEATYRLYNNAYDPEYVRDHLKYIKEFRPGIRMYTATTPSDGVDEVDEVDEV